MPNSDPRPEILFVSHSEQQCGVHQFGQSVFHSIKASNRYNFRYHESGSASDFLETVARINPLAVIVNHYPTTLPWLDHRVTGRVRCHLIGIIHEITQHLADHLDQTLFDFYIAADPTLVLRNPIVYKTGRLVPEFSASSAVTTAPTIGSFGFATKGKGFPELAKKVIEEFDHAILNLHIPFADFADRSGEQARKIAAQCRDLASSTNVSVNVSHDFLDTNGLLSFLAGNSINAFLYADQGNRGISSVIDSALAVDRPIAVSRSSMFRHLIAEIPECCIETSSLKAIMQMDPARFRSLKNEWSAQNLVWDYERILDDVLTKHRGRRHPARIFLQKVKRRIFGQSRDGDWVPHTLADSVVVNVEPSAGRETLSRIEPDGFNRILDDQARELYAPTIEDLFHLAPEVMKRKIPRANVQQAFVFDTVLKFVERYDAPRILSVGSFEDTATIGLRALSFDLKEIDPLINYDLSTYVTKPGVNLESFDIILSTSVIEHVADDESFFVQMCDLLAPGGTLILTCDFNDQYKPGDTIPSEDFRFYTIADFNSRLLPLVPECLLVDEPSWDCPEPDFEYAGCKYTFASLVVRKTARVGK